MQMTSFIAAGYGQAKNRDDLRHYFAFATPAAATVRSNIARMRKVAEGAEVVA